MVKNYFISTQIPACLAKACVYCLSMQRFWQACVFVSGFLGLCDFHLLMAKYFSRNMKTGTQVCWHKNFRWIRLFSSTKWFMTRCLFHEVFKVVNGEIHIKQCHFPKNRPSMNDLLGRHKYIKTKSWGGLLSSLKWDGI